ncbi:MAG: hypothetical protein ACOC56_05585 [Atribacterota bacterium]
MKALAYVQPIFAPDKLRFERNISSIQSMSDYLKENPYTDIEFHFGGWAKEEYWNEFIDLISKEFAKYKFVIKKFNKNYGKAKVVNTLTKGIDSTYILTADSDIIFMSDQLNLFERLIEFSDKCKELRGKPFGLVALNQVGQCCHLPCANQNEVKYKNSFGNEEIIKYPNGKGCIAGGCIFFENKVWKEIGGYREMGVYAGDDAYFLIDLCDNGKCIQYMKSLYIIHPHESDPVYAKWKIDVCQRDGGGKSKLDKRRIEEANKFWDTHGKN